MNYLRILLFFFVLLAPLQLTSARRYGDKAKQDKGGKDKCHHECVMWYNSPGCLKHCYNCGTADGWKDINGNPVYPACP